VYWSSENLNINVNKPMNLPGLSVWCDGSSRGVMELFFEGTVTGAIYLNMLQESIVPTICKLYGDKDMQYQQDGAPPHYHCDVWAYLDNTCPDQWIGCRGFVEYPP
jgi:hypothetical protein